MEKDQLLISKLNDKAGQCRKRGRPVYTGFLDSHEQAVTAAVLGKMQDISFSFDGGYEDAERRIAVIFTESEEPELPLCLLKIRVKRGSGLTHRDYLGSILGVGIDRSLTGDILVGEDGGDCIVLREAGKILENGLETVGRFPAEVSACGLEELRIPEQKTEIIRDTVASCRLDALVSSAFRMSREKAGEAVKAGLVSVNHLEILKADSKTVPGDVLSFRGKGRAVFASLGSESKKGRLFVEIHRPV